MHNEPSDRILIEIFTALKEIQKQMATNTIALADLTAMVTQLTTDTSTALTAITTALTDLAAANPSIAPQIEAQVTALKTLDANIVAAGTAAKAADPGATSTPAPAA